PAWHRGIRQFGRRSLPLALGSHRDGFCHTGSLLGVSDGRVPSSAERAPWVIMPTTAAGRIDPRTARLLEVESASTDALSIVITMVLVDLLVVGTVSVSRPFVALGRELGVGVGVGLLAAAALLLVMPTLKKNPHTYTTFLAAMLVVYGATSQLDGSGAM